MKLSFLSDKEIFERISKTIKERRIALNLTQAEASKKAGMNIMTLSNFERNGNISLKNLISILIAYGMEADFLKAFEDRENWSLEELKCLDKNLKRIRHGKK